MAAATCHGDKATADLLGPALIDRAAIAQLANGVPPPGPQRAIGLDGQGMRPAGRNRTETITNLRWLLAGQGVSQTQLP